MLYQLHEMQRAMLNPMTAFAAAGAKMFSSPSSPLSYLPFATRFAAGYELFYRINKDYEKPEFGLHDTMVDGVQVPVLENILAPAAANAVIGLSIARCISWSW